MSPLLLNVLFPFFKRDKVKYYLKKIYKDIEGRERGGE